MALGLLAVENRRVSLTPTGQSLLEAEAMTLYRLLVREQRQTAFSERTDVNQFYAVHRIEGSNVLPSGVRHVTLVD